MPKRQYRIDMLNYSNDGFVKSNCADITFYNAGSQGVIINDTWFLRENKSIRLEANVNEIDRSVYRFRFDNNPLLFDRSLVIFRKIYIS